MSLTKRHALALAAALTLAVGTGTAAVAGLARTPSLPSSTPAIVAPASQAAPAAQEVDD